MSAPADQPTFNLADVNSWQEGLSCTLTALAAITGKTPTEVAGVLQQAAKLRNEDISAELLDKYNINDWLRAVRIFGGDWTQCEDFSNSPYAERPTIKDWMASICGADLQLVFCDDGGANGHVFATVDQCVVDTYTAGRRVKFECVPPDFPEFRVKRTFLVWGEPTASSTNE